MYDYLTASAGLPATQEKWAPVSAIIQELLQVGLYKRSQGRITRQVTCAALWLAIVSGLYRLSVTLMDVGPIWQYGVPGVLLVLGIWISYRLVNIPKFADFLIAVEAEMNKVSWPTRHELIRASLVVLILILLLAVVLIFFDLFWIYFFKGLGVLGT